MFFYDSAVPAARAQFFDAYWKGMGQYGIKSVWLDASEPERAFSGARAFGTVRMAGGAYTDAEAMEVWVREHAATFSEGNAAHGLGSSDWFTLTRSAWVGSWQHSSALWSGDLNSTWLALAEQVDLSHPPVFSLRLFLTLPSYLTVFFRLK